ncbi:MAG: sialidase family protein [Armatimonadota bacterium]|nr:sialidase family protein [Armatimonadota bacterium]
MRTGGALMLLLMLVLPTGAQKPFYESQLLFPPERWHNHGSCIVELPNGDLLVCWYNGSGERTADDVKVEGMRKRKGAKTWSGRFLMADTVGFPDCNPCMFVDPQGRLWLMWVAIIANLWETALLRYQISDNPRGAGAPRWNHSDILILKPGDEFVQLVAKQCDEDEKRIDQILPPERREEGLAYLAERRKNAADKYYRRMGWMTRVHPFVLEGKRIIVPLYSDGFDFSIMAISDDGGKTWQASLPLVSFGGVQPSLVQKRDGTLVAYMRDNGPPPKRALRSESRDGGMTWSPVVDDDLPNPGSGLEVIRLQNGNWAMVCNDTEQGRHRLAVLISDDEGKSWRWKRYLENDPPGAGSYSYPSIVQAKDGTLHVTYTWSQPGKGSSIKYAHFNEQWVLQGD